MPIIDPRTAELEVSGREFPEAVFTSLYAGRSKKVAVLQGTTQDEYRLSIALRELQGFPTNTQTYESDGRARNGARARDDVLLGVQVV